jgi:hypothetical protein
MTIATFWLALCWHVAAVDYPSWKRYLTKWIVGSVHVVIHLAAMFALCLAFVLLHNLITPTIKSSLDRQWQTSDQPAIVRNVLNETLEPITRQAVEQRQIIEREDIARRSEQPVQYPRDRELPPLRPIIEADQSFDTGGALPYKEIRQLVGFVLYPIEMIIFGALIGSGIFGVYLVLTGVFGGRYGDAAFAAFRPKGYRVFLRIKFSPEHATVFPIGLKSVPPRKHWRPSEASDDGGRRGADLVPKRPLRPQLVEPPIMVK